MTLGIIVVLGLWICAFLYAIGFKDFKILFYIWCVMVAIALIGAFF